MILVEDRHYQSVTAGQSVNWDYTIPNGAILYLQELGLNGIPEKSCNCQIIWDAAGTPEILASSYDSIVQKTNKQLIGNGTKVLRIRVANGSLSAQVLGGYWLGEQST